MANVFTIKTFAQISNNSRKQMVWMFAVLFSFAFAGECFGIDEQSPETIIIKPPKVVDRPDFTFHFSGEDAQTKKENLQYSWRFDQKEWTPFSKETSAHIENLTSGLHLFEVRAKNEAGIIDATPDKVWFEVAKEPPETTIINAPKFIKTPDVTFHFSVEDPTKENNSQYSWRLDGGEWMPFSPKTNAPLDNLTNGMHLFEVKAKDELGNIDATPDKIWFEVAIDKEPPETEIINPPKVVRTIDFTFTFKGNDNLTKTEDLEYSWRLDGGDWALFSKKTNATLHNLTNGTHWVEVKARDDVGNVDATPVRVSFEVSIDQPPDTEILKPPRVVTSPEITFQFQGRDAETKPENLQYSWHLDDDDWSKPSKETTVKVTILTNGKHLFEARAHDDSGNVDQTPDKAWFEVAIPSPVIKITPLPQSPLPIPEITFAFEVEEVGDWLYSWQLDGKELAKRSKEQSTTLTNLTNGKHSFEVRAKNESDNIEAIPAQVWFEVAVDLQPPDMWIIDPPAAPIKSSQVTFNFSGKDNRTNTKDLQYSWHLDKGEWSPFSKATSATLSKLTNGTYTFEVRARDEVGNKGEYPAQVTFTVAIDPLRPPVIIINPPDAPLKSADVTLDFKVEYANADMIKNFEYSWHLDEEEWSAFSKTTNVPLRNLTNGKHLFEVQAKATSGEVEPIPAKIWFEVDVDRLPPDTIITHRPDEPLRSTEFTFEFSGTDSHTKPDDLVYSWRLSRIPLQESEEQWSNFSEDSSVNLTKLADGDYLFEVKAKDEVGNEDKGPAEVRFKVDVNAPETTIIDYPKVPLTEEVNITFQFSGTDLQNPEELEYSWRLDEGKWSAFSQNTSVQYSKLSELGNGKHWFEVRAKDKDGNIDPIPARVSFEVNIPLPPPFYRTKKFWYSIAAILGLVGIFIVLYFKFIEPIITVLRRFNPYRGDILIEDVSVRGELLQKIIDSLYNDDNIMLSGERRIGKTTLLRQLEKRLEKPLIPIYIDIGNIPEERFLGEVMKEIVENLHINSDELELQIKQDGAEYNSFNFREDFEKILSQLQKRYNENAEVVLLLDEIDVMVNYKVVPATLRKLLTTIFRSQLRIVGAGRNVTQIDQESPVSPLWNVFRFFNIPPLSGEEAKSLIKEPARQYIQYSDEAVENIITYSGSIPRHILVLCGYIVEKISLAQKIRAIITTRKVEVNSEEVQQVFESKMLKEPVFQAYWNNLPNTVFQRAWSFLQEDRLIDKTGELTQQFQEWIRSRQL